MWRTLTGVRNGLRAAPAAKGERRSLKICNLQNPVKVVHVSTVSTLHHSLMCYTRTMEQSSGRKADALISPNLRSVSKPVSMFNGQGSLIHVRVKMLNPSNCGRVGPERTSPLRNQYNEYGTSSRPRVVFRNEVAVNIISSLCNHLRSYPTERVFLGTCL